MATLEVFDDEGRPAVQWELGSHPLTVGRGEAADVLIEDNGLSRRHFTIVREGAEFVLRDLSSRNGTWLDGNRQSRAILHDQGTILAGRTRFRFWEHGLNESVPLRRMKGPHDTVVIPE